MLAKYRADRLEQDLNIKTEAGIAGVPKIHHDATMHQFDASGFTTQTMDLRPARDARFHVLSNFVIFDQIRVQSIMRRRMRPRANDRHFATQDIPELRQLVEACLAEPLSDACNPLVVSRRLNNCVTVLEHGHGTELEDLK